MRYNSVVIATNAEFLADTLREKLREASFQVFIAATDPELDETIKKVMPRFVFVESCFHGCGTDVYIRRIIRRNRNIHVAVWTASELQPAAAARFIVAGAESYFSLRDTCTHIETILGRIAGGRCYCPSDVEGALDKDSVYPLIGGEPTARQIEIGKMLVEGKNVKDIGTLLSLTVSAVNFHRRCLYRKLGASKTVDILRRGLLRGIFTVDDFTE